MEVRPATLAQVLAGKGGEMVTVENDVQNVANDLFEIDDHLRLRYSEAGDYFVVYWKPHSEEEGFGYLIFTATELDQRIVAKMREVYLRCSQPGFSYADELERQDAAAQKAEDDAFREANGEMYERLAFAIRKDLGHKPRVFVPGD